METEEYKTWANAQEPSVKYDACNYGLMQKWLRDVHHVHITIEYRTQGYFFANGSTSSDVITNAKYILGGKLKLLYYPTYEEALENGLKEALSRIKQ